MKCVIRRYDKVNQEWKEGYFARNCGFQNHWVCDITEAMKFESVKEARWYIKTYKIKNCEVEK